jgi:hypothetical protein
VKILVYGAGVIGTLYAARLQEGGHRVTVVARGERLADIRRYGLALEDIVGHGRSTTKVETTERLGPNDQYDIALIAVRRDQVASVVPELTANHRIPTLIFMLNNPTGSSDLAQALGRDRVLLGFPGAGGTRDGHLVRYAMIAQQPTTLGELDGQRTARLRELVETFRQSGFRTTTSRDMDAWLKAHAFFVTAVSGAIYMAGAGVRHLLLAPLLRLQNGRLRFWPPCSCRFRGDARTGERLSLLIGKERYRGSCAPPALQCNRRLCGVTARFALQQVQIRDMAEAWQWANVSNFALGHRTIPVPLGLWVLAV